MKSRVPREMMKKKYYIRRRTWKKVLFCRALCKNMIPRERNSTNLSSKKI
jgi:hypothetical protein